jgi:hypothetical protein
MACFVWSLITCDTCDRQRTKIYGATPEAIPRLDTSAECSSPAATASDSVRSVTCEHVHNGATPEATPRLCTSAECSSPAAKALSSVASPHRPGHHDQERASMLISQATAQSPTLRRFIAQRVYLASVPFICIVTFSRCGRAAQSRFAAGSGLGTGLGTTIKNVAARSTLPPCRRLLKCPRQILLAAAFSLYSPFAKKLSWRTAHRR